MKKLYEKSRIWFAVVCILVYVIGCSVADDVSQSIGLEKSVTLVFTTLMSAVLYFFLSKNGLTREYGLCPPKYTPGKFLCYLPLVLLASVNLWFGIVLKLSPVETALYVVSMLLVGFLEELIFRGLLFNAMKRDNVSSAIVVSSLTFGIGHIVNLMNGADLFSTLCQLFYAVAIGFLFVILFHRGGSLWPCVITHGVFNALSAFSNEPVTERYLVPVSIALIVLSLGYAFFLCKALPKPDEG